MILLTDDKIMSCVDEVESSSVFSRVMLLSSFSGNARR